MKKSILYSLTLATLLCTACGETSQEADDYASYSQETTTAVSQQDTTTSVTESLTTTTADTTAKATTTTLSESSTLQSNATTKATTVSTTTKATTVSATTKATTVSTTHAVQTTPTTVSETQPLQQTDAPDVSEPVADTTATTASGSFDGSSMTFDYDGNAIGVNMDMDSIVSCIGEPIQIDTAPSCYYDGDDKTYIYNDFTIYTYTYDGSVYYSQEVEFNSNTVYTDKGIHIGSTLAEVETAYGTGYTAMGNNYRYYASDDTYLYLYVDQDVVTAIGYVVEIDL